MSSLDESIMDKPTGELEQERVRAQFDRAAGRYDDHAFVQREVAGRLDERFDLLKVAPQEILDLGCGTGEMVQRMRRRYPKARIWGLDLAHGMLCRMRGPSWTRWIPGRPAAPGLVCADMHALPFAGGRFDIVVSNLALQWSADPARVFAEVQRLLRPGGVFMFTTLGPDTFLELRRAWRAVDEHPRVHDFFDMHDLGDALVRSGLADPVMDVEQLTVTYEKLPVLLRDIRGLGAVNARGDRARGLLTPRRYARFEAAYQDMAVAGGLPLRYEVVYGHAWGVGPVQKRQGDAVTVPLEMLKFNKKL